MKKLVLILILLPLSVPLFSQWGIKAGVNNSDLAGHYYDTESVFSFNIGGTYDCQLSGNWYFQPSLLFTSVGFDVKGDGFIIKSGQVRIHALEVPLNLSFRPKIMNDIKLLADFGLYTRYGLFGNKTYEYYSDTPKDDESPFDAYNRFEIGFNLGAGVQVQQYYGMFSFHRGLSNAEKDISFYHKVFRISLGYYF